MKKYTCSNPKDLSAWTNRTMCAGSSGRFIVLNSRHAYENTPSTILDQDEFQQMWVRSLRLHQAHKRWHDYCRVLRKRSYHRKQWRLAVSINGACTERSIEMTDLGELKFFSAWKLDKIEYPVKSLFGRLSFLSQCWTRSACKIAACEDASSFRS